MNVFDFDGTLYAGDSSADFIIYAVKKQPALIFFFVSRLPSLFAYKTGRIDKTELKSRIFAFLNYIKDKKTLISSFWNSHANKFYNWYKEVHKDDDAVISASPEFLLKPACEKLGIKTLIASRVNMDNGEFTGENCRGENKVKRFYEVFPDGVIENFYTDSYADLPLMKTARNSFLVKRGKVSRIEKLPES